MEGLIKYLPENGIDFVKEWIKPYPIHLVITKERQTKLGDYTKKRTGQHKVTVNGNLNPQAFFFVLTHELAHLFVREKFGTKVMPHGTEWKSEFGKMLKDSITIYHKDNQKIIWHHAQNPRAILGSDRALKKALFDIDHSGIYLENIAEGNYFVLRNKIFKKGEKKKNRYICQDARTKKSYLVHGEELVHAIKND